MFKDSRMSMKEKLIAVGSEKLADIIITFCGKNKDFRKDINMVIAGMDDNPRKISDIIKKEINAFKRTTKFVNCKESFSVSERLNNVRERIANDMLSKSPDRAFELMLEFLDTSDQTMERCDDSSGHVGQVFTLSCEDLGKIAEKVSFPLTRLIDTVFTKHMTNKYCIFNGIIGHFESSLKKEGLLMLKSKFEKSLLGSDNMGRSQAQNGLKCIADILKDVDAYISACIITVDSLDWETPGIVRRLIEHSRGREALEWLERNKANSKNHQLRVEAFKSIGELDKAQEERMIWFDESLSASAYTEILENTSTDYAASFRTKAMEKALSCPAPKAFQFLSDIKESEVLGKFIRLKHESLNDHFDVRHHHFLGPIAEFVEDTDPLAATVIYRHMIGFILDKVKSTQYKHAAKHILKCEMLSLKITDWESFENHSEYFEELQKKHKLKKTFWSCYEDAAAMQSTPTPKRRKV